MVRGCTDLSNTSGNRHVRRPELGNVAIYLSTERSLKKDTRNRHQTHSADMVGEITHNKRNILEHVTTGQVLLRAVIWGQFH